MSSCRFLSLVHFSSTFTICVLLITVFTGALGSRLSRQDAKTHELVYHYLGSNTPYSPQQDPSTFAPPPSSCSSSSSSLRLLHVSLLSRHGDRNPTSGDLTSFAALSTTLAKLNPPRQEDQWIKTWKSPWTSNKQQGELVNVGAKSMAELAERMYEQHNLGQFHWENIEQYTVRSTNVSRAQQSGQSFMYRLYSLYYGSRSPPLPAPSSTLPFIPPFLTTLPSDGDSTLRFFDAICPYYVNHVLDSPLALNQTAAYSQLVLPAVASQLANRLNATNEDLPQKVVKSMLKMCGFETSLRLNQTQHFCDLFTTEQLKAWSYEEDLDKYYNCGWGQERAYTIATRLLNLFYSSISDFVSASSSSSSSSSSLPLSEGTEVDLPFASLYFGHAETVAPFATLLGLFEDDFTLTADSTEAEKETRLWRSEIVIPYTANTQVLLYECEGDKQLYVRVMHNEREYVLPGCEEFGVYCPASTFLDIYKTAANLDFNNLCADL